MVQFPRWQRGLVLGICVLGLLLTIPNFVSKQTLEQSPSWLPSQQINLGLDLQGGAHLLYEVKVQVAIDEDLDALVDAVRSQLRGARIGYQGLGTDGPAVVLTLRDPAEEEAARDILRGLDTRAVLSAEDGGRLRMELPEAALRERRQSVVEQAVEIIRRRIDEFGLRESTVIRQGDDRVLVQIPGFDDPSLLGLGETAKMTFHLLHPGAAQGVPGQPVPAGYELMQGYDGDQPEGAPEVWYVVRKRVEVSGDRLVDASTTFDQGQPVVTFRFDTVGGKRFGDTTAEHVGERLAIVLDGKVISAPVIRSPILGGNGIISGSFTVQSADKLAIQLRAGALPAPLVVLEERTVGPSLGQDSIEAGELACAIGFLGVIVFMALAYGLFGLMANISLIVNLFLIMGTLSLFQATLTLPGIAGIVLTIGMAVDANVLIFERIREEVRNGRTPISAIDAGYRRAIGTIMDANITTLIASLLLFGLGSGPIKGFAITLSIGIATSMFTAIMVTRFLVVVWLRWRRPQTLPI
jgi:preprotein translocase subunit SecD